MADTENQREVFARNLKRHMGLRGVRQSDIASNFNIPPTTVSDWVNGKKYPRVEAMQRLAWYLGVSVSELTKDGEDAEGPHPTACGGHLPQGGRLLEAVAEARALMGRLAAVIGEIEAEAGLAGTREAPASAGKSIEQMIEENFRDDKRMVTVVWEGQKKIEADKEG